MNALKKHLNHCQKQYKMRSTPQNKQRLIKAEYNFERAKYEAQETWSDRLVSEFNATNNAKDFWNTFKKMTRKTGDKSVLPLMGDNITPVFDSRNKTEMLREISLEGTTLNMTTGASDMDFAPPFFLYYPPLFKLFIIIPFSKFS